MSPAAPVSPSASLASALLLAVPNPCYEDHGDPRVDPRWAHALGARVWRGPHRVDPLFDTAWLYHGVVVTAAGRRVSAVIGPHAARLAKALAPSGRRRASASASSRRRRRRTARQQQRIATTAKATATRRARGLTVYTSWAAFLAAATKAPPSPPSPPPPHACPATRRTGAPPPLSPPPSFHTQADYARAVPAFPDAADRTALDRLLCDHCIPHASPSASPVLRRLADRRAVKRAWEVVRVRRACRLTTDALEATRAVIPTFPDLAAFRSHLLAELAKRLPREVTAEALHAEADGTTERGWLAYAPIVTVGGPCPGVGIEKVHPKGFVNHVFGPTRDDVILVDVGVRIDGYCADITRTFPAGTAFSPTHQRLYDLVHAMYTRGASMLKPGVSYAGIGAAVRATMVEGLHALGYKEYGAGPRGWGDYMPHGLGHMVGLQVHDAPELHEGDYDTLQEGYVLTVEPGVYVDDMCVRIENTIRVTATGHEVLSGGCGW